MDIRERYFQIERETLSPYAMRSEHTRGRQRPEAGSALRTEFMRDRDRIIHSKAFRRLKDKTQVFINPEGSHYRTRLTHTMEVSQIARTIAKALWLNEDLTEAIALGHDLGHTPFGHAGERALAVHIPSFEHNRQSLRVVDKLEKDGVGLNLTFEVRDGIANHKKRMQPATLEGAVVSYADRIAYLNHDIDDSLRAKILTMEDFPKELIRILGESYSQRINTMISDIVAHSQNQAVVSMSAEIEAATDALRDFMFARVYIDSPAKYEEKKVQTIIDMLFTYYMQYAKLLPEHIQRHMETDGAAACVADYIAGMTDDFAVAKFDELFIPHRWHSL